MTVCEKAYAKINLYLDVTGRREDGFHNIISVMRSVSLCDEITLTATLSDKTEISIISSDKTLEVNESNLVYKSASKYLSYFKLFANVNVKLTKRIPIGSGLGGGSSDAAATLRAMNRIFGLASEAQLLEIAAELGSDVPFCLLGGCALCTGRGDKLHRIDGNSNFDVVIAIGKSRVSTPLAYSLLDEKYADFKNYTEKTPIFDIGCYPIFNIFEGVIKLDEIDRIKEIMAEANSKHTLMSGSGPSVFGIFLNEEQSALAEKSLIEQGFLAFRCRTK